MTGDDGVEAGESPAGQYWDADDLTRRLRRIGGQTRGMQPLVARRARCKEIETQVPAMQGALVGVVRVVVACRVADAIERGVGPLNRELVRRSLRRGVLS